MPTVSPTPTSVVTGWRSFRRELLEAGGVAVGRIIGFDRLSDHDRLGCPVVDC